MRRKQKRAKRIPLKASVDERVFLTLDMLGFNTKELIEILLSKVADTKICPCCNREVRPLIRGRIRSTDTELS